MLTIPPISNFDRLVVDCLDLSCFFSEGPKRRESWGKNRNRTSTGYGRHCPGKCGQVWDPCGRELRKNRAIFQHRSWFRGHFNYGWFDSRTFWWIQGLFLIHDMEWAFNPHPTHTNTQGYFFQVVHPWSANERQNCSVWVR